MSQCETISPGTAPREQVDLFEKNRAEEPFLIKAWRENNDPRALQKLIENYQPMIAKQIFAILAGRSVSKSHREDLQQDCTHAFIVAVNSYDETKASSLAAFAQTTVRAAALQYALDFRSAYRIGRGSDERKAYYAVQKMRAQRAGSNNDHISHDDIEAISKQTGASIKATKRAVESSQATQATLEDAHNEMITDDHGEDFVNSSTREDAMKEIRAFLQTVSDRNREIIMKSFFSDEEPSHVQLSEEYDVTPERVGQIKRKVLGDMAKHLSEKGLDAETLFG